MSQASVLVVGSSNTDMIVKVERLPQPGETVLGGEFATARGGKGANQAVGAARAGANVTFIARVGDDNFGRAAIKGFRADGICTDFVLRDAGMASGVALICVADGGQNSIAVAPGANSHLSPADVKKASSAFKRGGVLLLQLETPLETVRAAARLARKNDLRIILNPAPAQPLDPALLEGIYLLTPNEVEARCLTGIRVEDERSAGRAAARLMARGARNVIITMGARGAFLAGCDGEQFIPGFPVTAVDATGAGDVFNGALAAAVARGESLAHAAEFANAAAALSVTRLGAQDSAPRRAEIDQFMARTLPIRLPGRVESPGHRNGHNGTAADGRTRVRKLRPARAAL